MESRKNIESTLVSIGILILLLIPNGTRANIADNLLPGDRVETEKGCGIFYGLSALGATVRLESGKLVQVGTCTRKFSLLIRKAQVFLKKFSNYGFSNPNRELARLSEMRRQTPERIRSHLMGEYGLRTTKDLTAAMELLTHGVQIGDQKPSRAANDQVVTRTGPPRLVP